MSTRNPMIYEGMYCGNMTKEQVQMIMRLRESENAGVMDNMLLNFKPELIKQSIEERRSIREILIELGVTDPTPYLGKPRKYQTVGAAFMYASPRSMIADGVGLGKTAEVAMLLNFLEKRGELTRCIIAVEKSAVIQVLCEMIRFTGMYFEELPSEAYKIRKAVDKMDLGRVKGLIIKHSTLRSDAFLSWIAQSLDERGVSRLFNTIILDESGVIKNDTTKTAEYTRTLFESIPRGHMLNATAFETCLDNVYHQMDLMYPILLPPRSRIEKKHCVFKTGTYWKKGPDGKAKMHYCRELSGYKNEKEFKDALKLVYFGRSKKDVGLERPNVYAVYEVEPTKQQAMALAKGYRYMEVLNAPSMIEDMKTETNRANVPKIDRLMQLVENEFRDSSVMVYAWHIHAQNAIREEMIKAGRNPVIIRGDSSDAERWEAQEGFNSGKYDVLITNVKRSLNLHGGDVCIMYSVEGNVASVEQITGRVDRNVDESIKTFILLLYKGTDEYEFFVNTVKQRAEDSRKMTIDAEMAVNKFSEALGI